MKSFLFGLGLGVGLGILFAPMSGEETRSNLGERASDLANSARETYDEGRGRVQRGMETVRSTAERTVQRVRNVASEATGTTGTSI